MHVWPQDVEFLLPDGILLGPQAEGFVTCMLLVVSLLLGDC